MSYRLKALGPCTVFVAGASYRVEAGDPLHLSDAEAAAILSGPYKSKFAVISNSDPEPAASVREQSVPGGFFSNGTLAMVPSNEDGIYAPAQDYDTNDGLVAAGSVADPVVDVYQEYKQDGEKLLEVLTGTKEKEQVEEPAEQNEQKQGFTDSVAPKVTKKRRTAKDHAVNDDSLAEAKDSTN